jgi:hypothetical protein
MEKIWERFVKMFDDRLMFNDRSIYPNKLTMEKLIVSPNLTHRH